jgi:hypothetical protein
VAREESYNGLSRLLDRDDAPMPQGAQTYKQTARVLLQHIVFDTRTRSTVYKSLEDAQKFAGGSIQALGGYRYVLQSKNFGYIEYNGAIYYAWPHTAGDIDDAMPTGYNRVAADFLAQEEQRLGLR